MRFRDDPAGGLLLSILTAVKYTIVEEIFVGVVVYGGPASLDYLGDNLVYGLFGLELAAASTTVHHASVSHVVKCG